VSLATLFLAAGVQAAVGCGSGEGDVEVEEGEHDYVAPTFDDGTTEKWGILIVDGKVYGIVGPGGDHFTKSGGGPVVKPDKRDDRDNK